MDYRLGDADRAGWTPAARRYRWASTDRAKTKHQPSGQCGLHASCVLLIDRRHQRGFLIAHGRHNAGRRGGVKMSLSTLTAMTPSRGVRHSDAQIALVAFGEITNSTNQNSRPPGRSARPNACHNSASARTARIVTTSTGLNVVANHRSSKRAVSTYAFASPSARTASRRNADLRVRASINCIRSHGAASLNGRAGEPPPEPTSMAD